MSRVSLPFSYHFSAHPHDERMGVKVDGTAQISDKCLVLNFVATITENELDSKARPKPQNFEVKIPLDEIKFIGILRPPLLKDLRRKKPLTLYFDLKRDDSIQSVPRFDCVLNFKSGQGRLCFDRRHEHLAKMLKQEYKDEACR